MLVRFKQANSIAIQKIQITLRKSIAKGWKKVGVSKEIDGSEEMSPKDPFVDNCNDRMMFRNFAANYVLRKCISVL